MTFEEWLTKYTYVDTFNDAKGWLNDLCIEGLNMGDDILMYMQEAYEAGWNGCINDLTEEGVSEWVEIHKDDLKEMKL